MGRLELFRFSLEHISAHVSRGGGGGCRDREGVCFGGGGGVQNMSSTSAPRSTVADLFH